ncbi:hypothetical protein JOD54_006169 [Actinokineospora baliensis]|uniref:hypothetical protein n=1 Tax=Actinokineospora baliensis TaxID=547056 RepID=UPI00195DC2C0|nr:hypothetical protein [Actinokineospora baliensis]MBM7775965.1 hypothetical protein [Actinokineospora baliensis]
MGVVELVSAGTAASVVATCLTRYLIIRAALRGTKPAERPAILRALSTVLGFRRRGR